MVRRWWMGVAAAIGAILAHVLLTGGGAYAAPAVPGPGGEMPEGWVNTQWGPLAPADRALLEGVRRADLWEGPAGQMAAQKGVNPRVREIGITISKQHVDEIDPEVLKVAGLLGVPLPSTPNADQNTWLKEMELAQGSDFDQVFVDRLRLAHSKVFQLIATVRANTRNSVVRDFAKLANKYVDGHIQFLDSTGLVKFNDLPTPEAPAPAAGAARAGVFAPGIQGVNSAVVWIVLIIAVMAGGLTTFRIVRPR